MSRPADAPEDASPDGARLARATARASWPGRKTTLAQQSTAAAPPSSTPEERLAVMWQLALDAWAMAGWPLPDYSRGQAPGRVIRPAKTAD